MKIVLKEKLNHIIYQQLVKLEMQVLSQSTHPKIIRIYAHLEDDINYNIESELISGGELYLHLLKHKSPYGYQLAENIMKQLLLALNHINERGIVRWDLKPVIS